MRINAHKVGYTLQSRSHFFSLFIFRINTEAFSNTLERLERNWKTKMAAW